MAVRPIDAAIAHTGARKIQVTGGRRSSPLLIALGALWVLDGLLQLQPSMFTRAFLTDAIAPAAQGQPWFVTGPIGWTVRFLGPHIALWNAGFALVQIAIGVGIMWRPTARLALGASFTWAVAVWWLGEGLGGLASGQGSLLTGGPGAVVLYAVIGAILWPRRTDGRPFGRGRVGGAMGRIAWLVLWVGAGATQLASHTVASQLTEAAGDEPPFLAAVDRAMARLAPTAHGLPAAIVLGCLELGIGLGVLAPRGRRIALGTGIAVSVLMWILVQDFGGLFTGTATDPNAAPLYVLLAAALYRFTTVEAAEQDDVTRVATRPGG